MNKLKRCFARNKIIDEAYSANAILNKEMMVEEKMPQVTNDPVSLTLPASGSVQQRSAFFSKKAINAEPDEKAVEQFHLEKKRKS